MGNDSSTSSAFRESALDFLARSNTIARVRALRDTEPGYERTMWQDMARNGWFGVLIPEADGGLGLGLTELCAVAEQSGVHLLPEPFVAAGVQVGALLQSLPAGDLRSDLLGRLLEGRLLTAVAWQETLGQSEQEIPCTRAGERNAHVTLSGEKRYVALARDADGWIVSASTNAAMGLYWIDQGTSGVKVTTEPRADGSRMSTLSLDEVVVPASNLLAAGGAAHRAIEYANDVARIAQGAELLGVARRALEIALEYARTRVQFGKPIGSFQALQHRLVDAYMQTELCEACIAAAIAAIAESPATTAAQASRVKARSTHAALLVTRLAIQVHGAMGFTDECDVGLYYKRALALSSWLGNVAWHRRRRFIALRESSAHTPAAEPDKQATAAHDATFFSRETDWDTVPEDQFRQVVRQFFAAKFPPHLRHSPHRIVRWVLIKDWYLALSRQGWIAPAWPKEYGGMGLPPDKLLALFEEQERYGVARAPDQGILMLGPLLIRYGTSAQQKQFLPRILSGEHIWCQGYSEPNAGSDLASLRTEAVLKDDHFVVTGQKIWTTLAQDATHIFMLVRTDKNAKPQKGISFLLVDLATPGITIRPIRDLTGEEEFCEVFFDAVRVPRENLVGELNQGWTMAKALLGFERIHSGSPKQCQYSLAQLRALAHARGLFQDPGFGMRFTELELDAEDASAAYTHFADIVKRGEELPLSISYLKLWSTETYQRICALMVEAADEAGASPGMQPFGDAQRIDVLSPLYNSTPASVYAGSSEIQRNILAKSVLHLPT